MKGFFLLILSLSIFSVILIAEDEVVGLDNSGLADNQKDFLMKHGFVVRPDIQFKQMYELYEYEKYPFITVDSVSESFFFLLGECLKLIEYNNLDNMKKFSELLYDRVLDEVNGNRCGLSLLSYTAVPLKLFKPDVTLDNRISEQVSSEVSLIISGVKSSSPVKKVVEDYSLYKPRGIYSDGALIPYFQVMTWYARFPFRTSDQQQLKDSINLVKIMNDPVIREQYEQIDGIYRYLIGPSDDLTFDQYLEAFKGLDLDTLSQMPDIALEKLESLKISRINDRFLTEWDVQDKARKTEKGLRLFGMKYNFESDLFQQACDASGVFPSGLWIMHRLGNSQAYTILGSGKDNLAEKIRKTEVVFPENSLSSDILRFTKSMFETDKRAADIFKTPLFEKKLLNSALSTWALTKHAFILQQKVCIIYSCACSKEEFCGFVEPCPDSFILLSETVKKLLSKMDLLKVFDSEPEKIIQGIIEEKTKMENGIYNSSGIISSYELYLNAINVYSILHDNELKLYRILENDPDIYKRTLDSLKNDKALGEDEKMVVKYFSINPVRHFAEYFAVNLDKISSICTKQLENREIDEEDKKILESYGDILKLCHMDFSNVVEKDDLPKIADIFTDAYSGNNLSVATGRAMLINVLAEHNGRKYLTNGGVIPYYEFADSGRYSDEEWIKKLDTEKPDHAEWQKTFMIQKKKKDISEVLNSLEKGLTCETLSDYDDPRIADFILKKLLTTGVEDLSKESRYDYKDEFLEYLSRNLRYSVEARHFKDIVTLSLRLDSLGHGSDYYASLAAKVFDNDFHSNELELCFDPIDDKRFKLFKSILTQGNVPVSLIDKLYAKSDPLKKLILINEIPVEKEMEEKALLLMDIVNSNADFIIRYRASEKVLAMGIIHPGEKNNIPAKLNEMIMRLVNNENQLIAMNAAVWAFQCDIGDNRALFKRIMEIDREKHDRLIREIKENPLEKKVSIYTSEYSRSMSRILSHIRKHELDIDISRELAFSFADKEDLSRLFPEEFCKKAISEAERILQGNEYDRYRKISFALDYIECTRYKPAVTDLLKFLDSRVYLGFNFEGYTERFCDEIFEKIYTLLTGRRLLCYNFGSETRADMLIEALKKGIQMQGLAFIPDLNLTDPICDKLQSIIKDMFCGKSDKALEQLNRLIEENPSVWESYKLRAMIFSEMGQCEDALKDYNLLVNLQPDRTDFYGMRASIYMELSRFQEAINDYSKTLVIDPTNLDALLNRGILLAQYGNPEQAVKDLMPVAENAMFKETASYYLAVSYLMLDDYDSAMSCIEKALQSGSGKDNPSYLLLKAAILFSKEDFSSAAEIYSTLLEKKPDELILLFNRCCAYQKLKKLDKSLEDIEKALKIKPDNDQYQKKKAEIKELINSSKSPSD